MGVETAIAGGAAIGGITSLLSGIIGSQAANEISTIEQAGIAADIGLQRQGLEHLIRTDTTARNDSLPWMDAGRTALDQYMVEMGLPRLTSARAQPSTMPDWVNGVPGGPAPATGTPSGSTTTPQHTAPPVMLGSPTPGAAPAVAPDRLNPPRLAPPAGTPSAPGAPPASTTAPPATGLAASGFRATPGYEFQVSQGERGVVNNLGALGMKGSGAGLKALTRFRQGLADQSYGDYMTRLGNLATGGQQATSNANAQSLAGAGGVASALGGIGSSLRDSSSARASGYAAGTNSWLGALQGVGNTASNSLGWLSRYRQ